MKLTEHLRVKILLPVIGVMLFLTVSIFLSVYTSTNKSTKAQIKTDLTHVAASVSDIVSKEIETEFSCLRTLGHIPQLSDPNVSLYDKSQIVYKFFGLNKGNYIDLCILDLDGNAYISGTEKIVNFSERNYYKYPLQGKDYMEPPFVNKVTNAMAIFFGLPVKNESGKVTNVLFSVIVGYRFCEIMEKYPIGKSSTALVIDRNTGKIQGAADRTLLDEGLFITDYDPAFAGVMDKISAGASDSIEYKNKNGETTIAVFQPIAGTDWAIVAPAPVTDFDLSSRNLIKDLAVIFVLVIALGIAIILLVMRRIMKPIKSMETAIAEISMGDADLTKKIEAKSNDEIGRVVHNFNSFTQMLREIILEIKNSKEQLSKSGDGLKKITNETIGSLSVILDDVKNADGQVGGQVKNVAETVEAVKEITQSINAMENMIDRQSIGVAEASSAIEQMIGNIAAVNNSTEKMSDSFLALSEKAGEGAKIQKDVSQQIVEIEDQAQLLVNANKVINAIAGQTNLLAMNAAIEAAHAGEAGKGFAVVADEIRNLSETSSKQSKTIGQQIEKIRGSIESLVSASQESNAVFLSVEDKINETETIVTQIRRAMNEQHAGSSQVLDSLKTVTSSTDEVKKSSSAVSDENRRITEEISKLKAATETIHNCVENLNRGTITVEDSSKKLSKISEEMQESITRIGSQIDMFTV